MKLRTLSVFMTSLAAVFVMTTARAELPYGLDDKCRQGYVWREAFPGDHVCVTPEVRAQAAYDNSQANARREPRSGAYGPDTCRKGYVWREARPDDRVCVTPETRTQTASDNREAANRIAKEDKEDEKTYNKPRWFENRLDWCFKQGSECGQPAADNFCKRRRFTGARDFAADPNIGSSEPTRISGTNEICNKNYCTGFKYITCYGPVPSERIFANPVWKKYRLDACLKWGSECGKPAADEYCKKQGFSDSFYSVLDLERGNSKTRLIGTDEICDKNFCVGFQMIVCQ